MALIERELRLDPSQKSTELQKKVTSLDDSVASLTGRQFHARYTIPVRRRLSEEQNAARGATGETDPLRRSYEEKRVALETAMKEAFDRAIAADSIERLNRVLLTIERHREELEDT